MKHIRVVLTGGASGGHIYPLLAVSRELEKLSIDGSMFIELLYLGPNDEFGAIIKKSGIPMYSIFKSKFRRYPSFATIIDIPKFILSIPQALLKLFFLMPDVVFSKGGPGAFPVVLAAWFYRIPIIIHESDAVPGVTNLLCARFASRIAVAYERTASFFDPAKTAVLGLPVREHLLVPISKQPEAKTKLGFAPDAPLVLVIGGSQGARYINDFILDASHLLLPVTQILQQVGRKNFPEFQKLHAQSLKEVGSSAHSYKIVDYFDEDDLRLAYAAADLVITRPGSTLFELAALRKPSVLVPITTSANDHQRINAYEFSKGGAAIVIEEGNLLPAIFIKELSLLIQSPKRLEAMGEAAWKMFKPGCAQRIAEEILRLAG